MLPAATPLAAQDPRGPGRQPVPEKPARTDKAHVRLIHLELHGGPAPQECAPPTWEGGTSPQRLQSPAPWPASKGHDADFSKSFQGDAGRPGRRGPPGEDGAKGSKASAPEGPCCPAPATHQQCPLDPPKWEAVGTAHALSRPPASLSHCQTKGGRACRVARAILPG